MLVAFVIHRCHIVALTCCVGLGIDPAYAEDTDGIAGWSSQSPASGRVPDCAMSPWAQTPVDGFVLAKLAEHNLKPQPEADRYTLLRRVTAGLTGLPPSPTEIQRFLTDSAPRAYESLVDRLLQDEHFGERWARHWLDVARYGESDGILSVNEDKVRKDAWRYRDAVIRAFNADLPYDHFVRYQFFGPLEDELQHYRQLRRFIQLGTRLQNNADPNDKQFHRLDDMVSTTGSAFLAMTFGCARCHDHPVDPMTTKEYYQLTAVFFNQVDEQPKASARQIPLKITEPRLLKKGSWSSPGEFVKPGFVEVLMRQPSERWHHGDKSALEAFADWITDVEYGAGMQLARVIVNRLWHHHLGEGLVSTPNDFGALGARPTHPALLDWLAGKLIENGWRLKPIHRLILTSAVYRQSGATDGASLDIDADNKWLWHFRPQRLEAEMIRDRLLSVAGGLRTDLYGPSISIGSHKKTLPDTEDSWRRSIYLQAHRTVRHPTLSLFDPPITERSTGVRSTGAAPEGALFALNSPLVWDLAARFARRIESEVGTDPRQQVRHAYVLALSRPPLPEEMTVGLELLNLSSDRALIDYCHLLLGLNEFIYVH